MSFPTYPAYKDSGVEWLGQVPEHWTVEKLKRIATVFPSNVDKHSREGEVPIRLCNYTDVYYGDSITDDQPLMAATATTDQVDRFALKGGDVIITKDSETADDIAIAAYVPKDLPGVVCGYHLSMVRPRAGANGRFIKWNFETAVVKAHAHVSANGLTRVGLGQYAIDNLPFSFPPKDEQVLIASFLDAETAKIDALIHEQVQLIELLAERRQSTIFQATTKGLNFGVGFKRSGVEWIGEMPIHWAVAALNYRYEVQLGKMLDEKRVTGNHLAPYLRNVDVQWDRVNTDDLPQMDFTGEDLVRYRLSHGDLLVCEGGEVGRAAIWTGDIDECYYQKALHRLRPRASTGENPRYQFYLLQAAAKQNVFSGAEGKSTIAHLTSETLRRHRFPYPPKVEQDKIVSFLDEKTAAFDKLTDEAKSGVALLKLRSAALISSAVTGKIDVRGFATLKQ